MDIATGHYQFEKLWSVKQYKKAIAIYEDIGRPFWHAEAVGKYYERRGLTRKAMQEYQRLINKYKQLGLLPLPRGPVQLFKLGRWCAKRDPRRAKAYLKLYIEADKDIYGTGLKPRHLTNARCLLRAMENNISMK